MRKRILILDNEEDVLDIMKMLLDNEDFETIVKIQTDDIVSLVRAYQPSLILLDFGLNGMDGGECCIRLKRDAELRHIPVIIFTAYSNKGIAKGSYGCDDFVAKPFDINDMVSRIRLLINHNSAQSA